MRDLPLHGLAPGLLAHPAAPAAAMDQLKRRQIVRLVLQGHEAAWLQQRYHLGRRMMAMVHGSAVAERILKLVRTMPDGSLVFFGIGVLDVTEWHNGAPEVRNC